MDFRKIVKFSLSFTVLLLSCSITVTGTATNTSVVGPTAVSDQPTLQTTITNIFAFTTMGFSVGFDYPDGFLQGIKSDWVKDGAIQDPGDMIYPEHARIVFTSYTGEPIDNISSGIRVFRAAEIGEIEPPVMNNLNAVLAGQLDQRSDFPHIPGAGRLIDGQASLIPFQNGKGFRYLGLNKFDASRLNDTSMFYIYQGLTDDGQYLVSFIMSVDAPFITDMATGELFVSEQEFLDYEQVLNDRINAAGAGQFKPSLTILDELSASMVVFN